MYLIFSILEEYPCTDPQQQLKAAVIQFSKLCLPLEDQMDPDTAASGSLNVLGFLQQVQSSKPRNVVKLNQVPPFLQKFVSF